jgi:oxygen-independent coproporphyrinogen-3 oxidase
VKRAETIALYVHLPFCAKKCPYCAFASSELASHREADGVLDALRREADTRSRQRPWEVMPVHSLFFGGGTPSTLTGAQIEALVAHLRSVFHVEDDAEITLEANPGTLSSEKIQGWLRAGINRISLGVQSTDDDTLVTLGRIHSAEQARRGFARLRDAGYDNLNVDLMYGVVSDDPLRSWERTLNTVLQWEPEHLSAYGLTVEPGTEYARREAAGETVKVSEEIEREQYVTLMDRMQAAGYEHYEVSNWSKPGFTSRHNRSYWDGFSYLSLGPAGHSYDHNRGRRFWNERETNHWLKAVVEQGDGEADEEILTPKQVFEERLMLALRMVAGTDDACLAALAEQAGMDWPPAALERLLAEGWLERDGSTLRYTRKGLLIADEIEAILTS